MFTILQAHVHWTEIMFSNYPWLDEMYDAIFLNLPLYIPHFQKLFRKKYIFLFKDQSMKNVDLFFFNEGFPKLQIVIGKLKNVSA